jgi:UDP-N-acetylglucosamine 4,6-dehydratase
MNKTVIITGATGTLGSRIMQYHVEQGDTIYALSRCDHKIAQWSKKYPDVRWCLGDIRNPLFGVLPQHAVDVVYHCAALKHVDMGESYPEQYHEVNYKGTMNVFNHVSTDRFVFFSTDKAVLPVNFYGLCKAMAERHLISIKKASGCNIQVFRWGNIIGSQGSVIHSFINQLCNGGTIKVTHPDMTRFWLKIDDAVEYVTRNDHDRTKEVLIHPKIKSASVIALAAAVAECLGVEGYNVEYTGIRPGEKIHEHLKSDHDYCVRSDTADRYSHEELLALVGPTVSKYLAGE